MKKLFDCFKKMRFGVHPAFFVLVIFCWVFGGLFDLLMTSLLAMVHELGHALCARRLGYRLQKIRLLPYGAELSGDDSFLPMHEIKIALAGPITNLFICFFVVALMWLIPGLYVTLRRVCEVSLFLCVFNLLPFFPLDGSRVFLGIVDSKIERSKCVKILRLFSLCFGVLLLVIFFVSMFFSLNVTFAIMGVSLVFSSVFGSKNAKYERLVSKKFKRKKVEKGLVVHEILVLEDATLLSLFGKVDARFFSRFVVVDNDFVRTGELDETELENFASVLGAKTSLKKVVLLKNH